MPDEHALRATGAWRNGFDRAAGTFRPAVQRLSTGLPVLLGTLLLSCLQAPAAAQTVDEPDRFHWAYAAHFGTGIYSLSDGADVLILRVPARWTLREPDPAHACACGIRLFLPFTVGIERFDRDEAPGTDPPKRARQLSFLPGVELEFPRSERWTLRTRAQLGWGRLDNGARETALIYAAGIRSRLVWPEIAGRPGMINGLLWSAYDPAGGPRRSMSRISNGVEFDIPVPRWQFRDEPMRLMPHFLTDWYIDTLDARSLADGSIDEVDVEWEIGLAAGREKPFSILGLEFDRLGFALRFSEHSKGIRLFVGSIF